MKNWQHIEYEDEQPYTLLEPDPLGVLQSTLAVVEQGEHVWINPEQVQLLSTRWIQEHDRHASLYTPPWFDQYHFFDGTEHTVNWLFVLDALNFCFWAEKDQPRWQVSYNGEKLNGYWAEAAALKRAVEDGKPLWDAQYLSELSSEELAAIFRGEPPEITIPLFEQRLNNIREVGRVLLTKYQGQFIHVIEEAQGDAVQLVHLITRHFPSFHDVAFYRGREICFFKRAQICVADLHGAFKGQDWGAFAHMEQLTAFADYKVPQVLRSFGVLEYDPRLAERIDRQEELRAGGEEEIEIRAATIWACELLRRELSRQGRIVTATDIDQHLWLLGQNAREMRPYHRTRTIYY